MNTLSRYIGKKVSDIAIMKSLHLLMVANISIQEALRRVADKLPDSEMADRLSVASDMVSKEGSVRFSEAMRVEVGIFEKLCRPYRDRAADGKPHTVLKELIRHGRRTGRCEKRRSSLALSIPGV
jgi:type II secretory pathway component PulF